MSSLDHLRYVRNVGRFTDDLRYEIYARDIPVRALADVIGISHTTLYRIMTGTRNPSLDMAIRIAKGLEEMGAPLQGGYFS